MENLDDVLNGEETEFVEATEEEAQALSEEAEAIEEEVSEGAQNEAAEAESESPPPGDENNTTVPLSALEKVRHEKTDWKEKAIRAQAELEAMQKFQQPQQEQAEIDPLQRMQRDMINERFNTSEMLVRQQHKDVEEKLAIWQEAVRENPALESVLQNQKHPWDFMYKEASKIQLEREIGGDPNAYKQKLREELKAELQAEMGQQPAATQHTNIPKTLAGSRSSASRSSSTFTGPSSLDDILN